MCLQRYILNQCDCLDGRMRFPLSEFIGLLCGDVKNTDSIAFPDQHNLSHCLTAENMATQPECIRMLGKLMNDLQCMKRVKKQFVAQNGEGPKLECHCPEPCKSFRFDTIYSLASWPTEGPQLEAAYQELVVKKMIPFFMSNRSDYNDTSNYYAVNNILRTPWLSAKLIQYLSNANNKKDILSNFVRITVYIKDLTVETVQDVAEYSWVDLLSDIGKYD